MSSNFPDYEQHDAVALAECIQRGDATPEDILEAALERLTAWEPHLNAVAQDMESSARRDVEAGLPQGAFRGVPFAIKDLGTSCQGLPTTNGCALFRDAVADHDSELIRRYKRAGLVPFAKTTTPEFGLTTSTESLLFGATHNPWQLDITPGGSSGGSAALVAAGVLPAADGSDGGGSIRIPAACCGLFGLKPSRGAISMAPDAGEGWSGMSSPGVITRTVRDTAALLDCIAGNVSGDPYFGPPAPASYRDEVTRPPQPLRIALHTQPYNGVECDPACAKAVRDAAALCGELGHVVEEKPLTFDIQRLNRAVRIIVAAQTRRKIDDRLEKLNRPLDPDTDLEPLTHATYERAARYTAAEYVFAINTLHAAGRAADAFLEDYDLVLTPTMAAPPQPLGGALRLNHPDPKAFGQALAATVGFTQFYNVTGQPAASVPLGSTATGLPLGVQFAARYGNETMLLRLAAQLEEARPWSRTMPALPQ